MAIQSRCDVCGEVAKNVDGRLVCDNVSCPFFMVVSTGCLENGGSV